MTQPLVRFSKPSAAYVEQKAFFLDPARNTQILADNHRVDALYASQPLRADCRTCGLDLDGAGFVRNGVGYVVCRHCGHLNGRHQETDAFCAAVYSDAGGGTIDSFYAEREAEGYARRVADIYVPKAEFLKDALAHDGAAHDRLACVDFGAGSGFFLAALDRAGFSGATGLEPSALQVARADALLGPGRVRPVAVDGLEAAAATVEAELVSMIYVMEHLRDPRAVMAALKANPKVRYLYLSVPMWGPSALMEGAFPDVPVRLLGGVHTHLYTDSSLAWLGREFGLTRVGEWWFGSDGFDLVRSVSTRLQASDGGPALAGMWFQAMAPLLDELQAVLDRRRLCSDVHMLLRFDR